MFISRSNDFAATISEQLYGRNSSWRLADHLKNLLESVGNDKLDFQLGF